MPHCFVKQPNGKLAIWSTVVDNFIMMDCDADEAIADELHSGLYAGYSGNLRADLCRELENIAATGRAWDWSPTWDEALSIIAELHGDHELEVMLDLYFASDDPSVVHIKPRIPDPGTVQQLVPPGVCVVLIAHKTCDDLSAVYDQAAVMPVCFDSMVHTA